MKDTPHGTSKAMHKLARSVLAGGQHYNFSSNWNKTTLYFKGGQGTRLWDLDGKEYLDFYGKFGAAIFGHNHREYIEAIFSDFSGLITDNSPLDYQVSQKIIEHVPSAELVRYGLSGTETVLNALRVARASNKKRRFIRFEGHYHGNADNIMGGRAFDARHPVPREFPGDPRGTQGRADGILESQSFILPWNDPEAVERLVGKYRDEISAIILEPICINGGGILPAEGFLETLRRVCDEHDIVLIFDEIITGFRVGVGGAQSLFNVTPDLTTFGKAVSGGALPVSILTGKRRLMRLIEKFKVTHAGTFNGYQLGMLALRSALRLFEKDDFGCFRHMERCGKMMADILLSESRAAGVDLQVQGHPAAMYLHNARSPLDSFRDFTPELNKRNGLLREVFLKNGIILSPASRIYLNTSVSDDDIDFFEQKVKKAFSQFRKAGKNL